MNVLLHVHVCFIILYSTPGGYSFPAGVKKFCLLIRRRVNLEFINWTPGGFCFNPFNVRSYKIILSDIALLTKSNKTIDPAVTWIAMNEETPYSLLQQGKDLLESGNPAQAAVILERAREMAPEKGSILEVLGRAYFLFGEYGKASECYGEAVEVDPTNDYAHYCLGLCFLKGENKQEAGRHFKIAWSLRPLDDYRFMALRFGAEEED